jgi:regulator of nucleoside diphosphate kinase
MTQSQHEAETMPAIVVSDFDYNRLTSLAAVVGDRTPDVASALQSEMERARVVPAGVIPAAVVRMGSTVEFGTDTGQQRKVTLVFPGDADIAADRISILTPIDVALIGLSPGQSIAWMARDGRRHQLTVLYVEPPAASAGAAAVGLPSTGQCMSDDTRRLR